MSDLSPQQAAGELGCSRTLVYRLIQRGELPVPTSFPVAHGSAFRADLDALKERNRVRAYQELPSYEPRLASTRGRESGSFAGELSAIERGDAA